MRIRDLKFSHTFTFFAFTLLATSCAPRPGKVEVPESIDLPSEQMLDSVEVSSRSNAKGVWIATTTYKQDGGTLARLDLKSGEFKSDIFRTGPDVQIFEDSAFSGSDLDPTPRAEGLFVLTRNGNDSLTRLESRDAKLVASTQLPLNSNPQSVARDGQGRPWVTLQESNDVQIIAADLSSTVNKADLSSLKEQPSTDGLAELSQVVQIDSETMGVVAQRLHRSSTYWQPDPQSGLATVNSNSLQIETVKMTDATNPGALFAQGSKLFVFGSGDLYSSSGAKAKTVSLDRNSKTISNEAVVEHSYRIVSAYLRPQDQDPALIAWYPGEQQSCIQIGEIKIHCEGSAQNGGFVFNQILRRGKILIIAYVASGNSELWLVSTENHENGHGKILKKIPMKLPIVSLSFGP